MGWEIPMKTKQPRKNIDRRHSQDLRACSGQNPDYYVERWKPKCKWGEGMQKGSRRLKNEINEVTLMTSLVVRDSWKNEWHLQPREGTWPGQRLLATEEDQEWDCSISPAQAAGERINKALSDKVEQETHIRSSELNFTLRRYHTKQGQNIFF